MRAIRFRCPRCRVIHTVSVARAGQPFACSSCFAPMSIPEATDRPSAETPLARSIEVAPAPTEMRPPDPVVIEIERKPAQEVAPRPKRRPVAARPSPVIEFPVAPEPAPVPVSIPVDLPIDLGPISDGPVAAATVPPLRIALALGSILGLVVVAVGLGVILGPGQANEPAAVAEGTPAPAPVPAATNPPIDMPGLVDPEPAPAPVASQSAPAPNPKPAPDRPLVIRRRQTLDQEALRRQLAQLPELAALDKTRSDLLALHGVADTSLEARIKAARQAQRIAQANAQAEAMLAIQPILGERNPGRSMIPPRHHVQQHHRLITPHKPATHPAPASAPAEAPVEALVPPGMHVAHSNSSPHDLLALIAKDQPELVGLPWRMGDECHLTHEAAEDLQAISRALRIILVRVTPEGDTRPDADQLREAIFRDPKAPNPATTGPARARAIPAMLVPAAIPALQQLLMAERTPVRLVLAEALEKIPGRESTHALARLAIFDLAPEVRERALMALRARPAEDSRPALLEGLRFPWTPVADHAAEALVALGDRDAVPSLVDLLDQPDPTRPKPGVRDGKPVSLVSSMVQVNHLRNCLLCHAPSGDARKDLVRGGVPEKSQPLPPPVAYYEGTSPGLSVKAEVTYLRQELSTTQPVEDSDAWPSYQRYDYLIANQVVPGRAFEIEATLPTYPQRESTLFALRELTGQDAGTESAAWKAATRPTPSGN
jgi:hypothetical protein